MGLVLVAGHEVIVSRTGHRSRRGREGGKIIGTCYLASSGIRRDNGFCFYIKYTECGFVYPSAWFNAVFVCVINPNTCLILFDHIYYITYLFSKLNLNVETA